MKTPEPDIAHTRIPTRPGGGRGLVFHDKRSRAFPAAAKVRRGVVGGFRSKSWRRRPATDQGETQMCVAHTGLGILNASPATARIPLASRRAVSLADLYDGARFFDEWPGSSYEGSSGLGLCRYLADRGLVGEYRWCFSVDDIRITLAHLGPVGLGVNWRSGMLEADGLGRIHATGEVWGGHEVMLSGVDEARDAVVVTNSWGTGWGRAGRALLGFADLELLMADQGDAFVITG